MLTPHFDLKDSRAMIALYRDMQDMRKNFTSALQFLLSRIGKLIGASTIAAYRVSFFSPVRAQAQPLIELKSVGKSAEMHRSALVGAAFVDSSVLYASRRAGKVLTDFGSPDWAADFEQPHSFLWPHHTLHSVQYVTDSSGPTVIAVVLSRGVRREPFAERELAILDMIWRSHRIVFNVNDLRITSLITSA